MNGDTSSYIVIAFEICKFAIHNSAVATLDITASISVAFFYIYKSNISGLKE